VIEGFTGLGGGCKAGKCGKVATVEKKIMTLENVREALKDRRINVVAKATGLSRDAIADIRNGTSTNPRYQTVQLLADYLMGGVACG